MPTAWAQQVVVSEAEADAGATLERVRYVRNVFDEVDAFIGSFVLTASEQENLGDEEEIRELFYERIAGLWFDKGRMSDGAARTRRHNRELLRRQAELRDPLGPSYGGACGPSSWGAPQLGGAARLDGAPHWNSRISQG